MDFCILFNLREGARHSSGKPELLVTVGDRSQAVSTDLVAYAISPFMMSSEEKLKAVASITLNALFSASKVETPVSSFDLLSQVVTHGPPSGALPNNERPPSFRLTQLPLFERILERLSECWEYGRIKTGRDSDSGELTVLDVRLGESHTAQLPADASQRRKRKRVVDEDADSAAGDAEEEQDNGVTAHKRPAPSTLDSLSQEMQEVYSLLQRGTAKNRLLAEQVRSMNFSNYAYFSDHIIVSNYQRKL